jgi:hypothetical protein
MADDLWEELTTLTSSFEEDLEEEEFTTDGLIDIPALQYFKTQNSLGYSGKNLSDTFFYVLRRL